MTGSKRSAITLMIAGMAVLALAGPVSALPSPTEASLANSPSSPVKAGDQADRLNRSGATQSTAATTSTATANLTIMIENPAPTEPSDAEVLPVNDSLNPKRPFTDNVTYTGLEPGTYKFEIYNSETNAQGEQAWWGNLTVTLDAGEEKKVTFTRYTPYVENTFTLPNAPRDPAEGPRFHYRDEDDINITAEIHNPDDQSHTVALEFRADGVGFPVVLSPISVPAGSSKTVVLEGGDFESGRKYEVGYQLSTDDYGSTRITSQTVGIESIQEFWLHDRMLDIRKHNWAYNGSLSTESLAGNELAEKGPVQLDGTGVKIAFIGVGIDLSNPAVNRLDESSGWLEGRMNVKHGYNTGGSGIGIDPSKSSEFHGMAVAGAVWQFAPNATYYIVKATEGIDWADFPFNSEGTKDEIHEALDHVLTHDPDVIVMSMGFGEYPNGENLADQFSKAVDEDTTVIVSAGNKGPDDFNMYVTSPAYGSAVLATSSINRDGSIDRGSSPGNATNIDGDPPHETPDLAAPNDYLTFGTPDIWSGSSFSSPATAGVVAQLTQHAYRHGMTATDVRQAINETAIPTTTFNGSQNRNLDNKDGDADDDLDGSGRVRPLGAYHELLANDAYPQANVIVSQINATTSTVTIRVTLNNTGARAGSGGVYLAISNGSFLSVNPGGFRTAANVTSSEMDVTAFELYTWSKNVTSGNITIEMTDDTTIDLQYRGWLFDRHDAVYNPYRGRYERYVARDPAETKYDDTPRKTFVPEASGSRLLEGQKPSGAGANPPYNRHIGDEDFTIANYATAITTLETITAPEAAFTYSPKRPMINQTVTLNASASTDDGSITRYQWDIDNDGQYEKSGETVSHAFESPGDHRVFLKVTDNKGVINTTEHTITVRNAVPTAVFNASPAHPTEEETVLFNASRSDDPDATIDKYLWNFDTDEEIEALGVTVSHTFSQPGQHNITLQVIDSYGATNTTTRTINVNAKPQAKFSISPSDPTINELIEFDAKNASDDGTIVRYAWDFDTDSAFEHTQTDSFNTYTFTTGGNYTVRLRVTDDDGATDTIQKSIPVSEFILPNRQLQAPDVVPLNKSFNASIRVTNRGARGTESLWFKFFIDRLDPLQVWKRTVSLQQGASRNITFTVSTNGLAAGGYQQKVFLGADNQYFARNTSRTDLVAIESANLSILWYKPVGPRFSSPTPVTANGLVYFSGGEGNVTAINASTGDVMWRRDVGCEEVSMTIDNETIYLTQSCGDVYALDAMTGTTDWHFTFSAPVSSYAPPVTHDETVYVSYENSSLYAFYRSNGTIRWKFKSSKDFVAFSKPTLVANTVYVTGNDASVYALNASSGAKRWSTNLSNTVLEASSYEFAPAVHNGSVYVSTIYDDVLYVLDAETGSLQQEIRTGGSSAPVVHNGSIYVSGPVMAIDPATQSIEWRTKVGTDITSPTVSDELLIVGDGNQLTVMDAQTGTILSEFGLISGNYEASTAINGTRMYAGTLSGRVWAFDYLRREPSKDEKTETRTEGAIAPFAETVGLTTSQTAPDSLAGKIQVEQDVAANSSVKVLRHSAVNYSIAITAPERAENVTVYLQKRAISVTQDLRNLTMYLDGKPHRFVVNESVGSEESPWVAFNMPHFSTRTVTFTGTLTTNVSVTPATRSVGVSETTTFEIVVETADGGVGAYSATISLANATVATITNVTLFGNPGLKSIDFAANNASVTIDASLMDTNNTGTVTIARITVKGTVHGTTTVGLNVSALGNESGIDYAIAATHNASIAVRPVPVVGTFEHPPTDPDGDGLYEDINGNGEANIVDVQAMFVNRDGPTLTGHPEFFDFSGNGEVDIVDIQALFVEITS